jgi:predicted RecA/RadA family phage recombinase
MKKQTISVTTIADGSGTGIGHSVFGELCAVEYQPGTIATGATITLTCDGVGSKPLLTKASAGTAVAWFYPRDLVHAVADGAALTGTSGGDRTEPILSGVLKIVVASGGDTKTGKVIFYYED